METPVKYYYTYYSYEEYGRGYIGSRKCECLPENDIGYFGSYTDKTFKPKQKIILAIYRTREEAIEAEILLHEFYDVSNNPHFANRARATSTGFYIEGESARENGKRIKELGLGFHGLSKEEKSKNAKKAGLIGGNKQYELGLGIHAQTLEDKKELGRMVHELGIGIHGLDMEKKIEYGRKGGKKGGAITAEKRSKEFALISPKGKIYTGKNIRKFCREHDLNQGNINQVLVGNKLHHKGWRKYCEVSILDFL
jgi:hypothetical protein